MGSDMTIDLFGTGLRPEERTQGTGSQRWLKNLAVTR